jgi:hypothetical protein
MAMFNKVQETNIKNKFSLLFINTIIMIFLLFSVGFQITKGYYIPLDEDEAIYLSSGKLFYETNSTKSVGCINEERSKIGEFNWYGPFFHLLYGSVLKMTKGNYGSIFFFNIILLVTIFIKLNFRYNDSNLNSVLLNLGIFSLTPVSLYTQNYYPVCFFVFINLVVLRFYLEAHFKPEKLMLFLAIVLLCTTIRITYFFWVFVIFFIPNQSKTSIRNKFVLFLLSTLFLVFYMKFFTARPYQGIKSFRYVYDTFDGNNVLIFLYKLKMFIRNSFDNVMDNYILLFKSFDIDVYLFHLILVLITVLLFRRDSRVQIQFKGLYFYICVYYVALILLYKTSPFYFVKQICFVLPIIIFLLIQLLDRKELLIFCFVCLLFLPFRFNKIVSNLQARKEIRNNWDDIKLFRDSINDFIYSNITLDNRVSNNVNVLFPYAKLGIPGNLDCLIFPLSKNGISILYTCNPNGETLEDIYKLHNKIQIDYIFALNNLNYNNYKLIDQESKMKLYRKQDE